MNLTFEDKIDEIDALLSKKRGRWYLSYPHFDDVQQILRKHIWIKFDLWDQSRSFVKWASKVMDSQIINLIRNHYGKVAPPCSACACDGGGQLCSFTKSGTKCSECPLYKKWEKKKQTGYNLKFASSIEFMSENGGVIPVETLDNFDLAQSMESFHARMKDILPERLYMIYEMFYINGNTDAEVSQALGLKNNEKNSKRVPGYKMLHNYKERLMAIGREVIKDFDLIKM